MKKHFIIKSEGLTVYYDSDLLAGIQRKLGDLSGKSRNVLKNAVNATAKQAKKYVIADAQEAYTAKAVAAGKDKDGNISIKKASNSNLDATVNISGKPIEIKKFKTRNPKSGSMAQILSSGSMKLIQSQKGTRAKAFLATFESDHTAVVQRQDGKMYTGEGAAKRRSKWGKNADMTAIKSLLSVSYPKMVGGKRVYQKLAPEIYEALTRNINLEIQKVMNK